MKHKRQHFIPQSYLAGWLDPQTPGDYEPYVWLVDKHSLQLSKRSPKNIFFKTDYYTFETEEGERDLYLEQGLAKIESEFVRVRDRVITNQSKLDENSRIILIVFLAAMHSRTPASGEKWTPFWQRVLDKMEALQSWDTTATREELALAASNLPINDDHTHIVSIEDVQELVDFPVQSLLIPSVIEESKLLINLDLAIIRTNTSPGFITSDNPVVWFDPEGHKRPPPHQGPALIYPSIEINMPISPTHNLFLNRQGVNGYVDLGDYGPQIDLEVVNGANWRVQKTAQNHLVVNRGTIRWKWFY